MKTGMTAVKLPKKHMDFVSKNPMLAQGVGRVMILMSELKGLTDMAQSMGQEFAKQGYEECLEGLKDPSNFMELMKDGTEEQLQDFLNDLASSLENGGVSNFDNIEPEQLEEFKQKAADAGVQSQVTEIIDFERPRTNVNPNLN